MSRQEITIRSIQHYMYCPHRWGLLEIGKVWAENFYVTKANLMHGRVHDPENHYTARGKKVFTSVPVYNDREEYDLYGVVDCIECVKDEMGVQLGAPLREQELLGTQEFVQPDDDEGRYRLCIVEYKPTKAKNGEHRDEDVMQVFAQKICVDNIFGCNCDTAIYYADVRKRYDLDFSKTYREYDERLRQLLVEMRSFLKAGRIPEIRSGQKCSGCSMKDICMPKLKRSEKFSLKIEKMLEDEEGIAGEQEV